MWLVTISFIMSLRPHGTTGLPIKNFWLNKILEVLTKIFTEYLDNLKYYKNYRNFLGLCIFLKIIRRILLRMRNFSDERSKGNVSTHFIPKNAFSQTRVFYEKKASVILCIQIGYRWQWNTAHDLCLLYDNCYKYIHYFVIYFFPTSKIVALM
jgi:hypothetical protein